MQTRTRIQRPGERLRELQTENAQERALLAHVRGWCHNGSACALCDAQGRAFQAERALEGVISGSHT